MILRNIAALFLCMLVFADYLPSYEGKPDRFVVVTPEKTGTHLLMKTLRLLLDREPFTDWSHSLTNERLLKELNFAEAANSFMVIHLLPEPHSIELLQQLGYKIFFMIRDPRDQVISLLFFLKNKPWQYGPLNPKLPFGKLNFDDQLEEAITGIRYGCCAPQAIIGRRLPWMHLDPATVLTVKFENLVGKEGGGSEDLQMEEIRKITKHIGLQFSDEEIMERKKHIFGVQGEDAFRSGQIGEWRKYFKPWHVQAFKAVFGKELILLGYEKDMYWE